MSVSGAASELRARFRASKSGLSPHGFPTDRQRRFLFRGSSSLCVCGFMCGVCFAIICVSYIRLLVPPKGCAS